MNKQNPKKLNNHQRLIAAISIVVVILLAICVTFAWFTNKIYTMKGKYKLGSFNYTVALYDVDVTKTGNTLTVNSVTKRGEQDFTRDDSESWELENNASEVYLNNANGFVRYQVIKVANTNSGFDLRAYEYLKYDENMTEQQKTLANYFYFKPVKLAISSSDNFNASQIQTYLANNTGVFPAGDSQPGGIAHAETDITFGKMQDNAIALESGTVANGQYSYYLVGYCVTGLANIQLDGNSSITVQPVIAIGQSGDAPTPQSSAETKTMEVSNWQDLRAAIAEANEGDTIQLTANVAGSPSENLSITKGLNLDLNSYNLTVQGDFVYSSKTAQTRNLLLPAPSVLTVKGDMIIETPGAFNIYSNVANENGNIKLGYANKNDEVIGGEFKVNCGQYFSDGDEDYTGIKPETVNENAGLILNNCVLVSTIDTNNGPALANSTLSVVGSNTTIKTAGGAHLEAIQPAETTITNLYIFNHATINNLNLAVTGSTDYLLQPSTRNQVSLYVKNYNVINRFSLPDWVIGYTYDSSTYNTRLIDNNGAQTSFKNAAGVVDGSQDDKFRNYNFFSTADVEPFAAQGATSEVVRDESDVNTFTVYYRAKAANDGENAEDIETLFNNAGYSVTNCYTLKIETASGIALHDEHFDNYRAKLSALRKVDLSNAALLNQRIPSGAFENVTTLTEVVFPIATYGIEADAFKGTAIQKVTFGTNLSSSIGIGTDAFDVSLPSGKFIEVIWNNPNRFSYTDAFDVNKTLVFMSKSLLESTEGSYTTAWIENLFEFYDFKANNDRYYCKYATDVVGGCEIIFYNGTIAEVQASNDKELVPASLSDSSASYTVAGVCRRAFKRAIYNDSDASNNPGVKITLTNCLRVGKSAFEGTGSSTSENKRMLYVSVLDLGKVNRIGAKAFKSNQITNSNARPSTGNAAFTGMVSLGEYAFDSTIISGGILDLSGSSVAKYTPDDFALSGLKISGGYANGENGNAVLDLSNIGTIYSNFAFGTKIAANLILTNTDSILSGAFANTIISNGLTNASATNVVDVRDVKMIGQKAFSEVVCGTFYLGTHDDARTDVMAPYQYIIAKGTIQNMVLDGGFVSSSVNAIASDTSTDVLTIGSLRIKMYKVENTITNYVIPNYAFACDAGQHNLALGAVTVDYDVREVTENNETYHVNDYASFNIGNYAFYGVNFTTQTVENTPYYYDFSGVRTVGDYAFAESTIRNLGLGTNITSIASSKFIWHCDYILKLRIEKSDAIVPLGDSEEAVAAFTTQNTTRGSDFTIQVDNALLTSYIQNSVWKGWKNYFAALYYYAYCKPNTPTTLLSSTNTTSCIRWTYNVIQPGTDKGIQIIKCDTVIPATGATAPLMYHTRTTRTPYKVTYAIAVPYQLKDGNGNWQLVTEFGADEDMFGDIKLQTAATQQYPLNTGGDYRPYIIFNNTQDNIKYISPTALRSDKILNLLWGSPSGSNSGADTALYNNHFFLKEGGKVLYYKQNTGASGGGQATTGEQATGVELVKVLPSFVPSSNANTFVVPREVETIRAGAFEGCDQFTKITLQASDYVPNSSNELVYVDTRLKYIEADAFNGADNLKRFDFSNAKEFISIGESVFGEVREKLVDNSGHYYYAQPDQKPVIIIPAPIYKEDPPDQLDLDKAETQLNLSFRNSYLYFFYESYNCLFDNGDSNIPAEPSSATGEVVSQEPDGEVQETKRVISKLALKNVEADETLAGIQYHLMNSGGEYDGVSYTSKNTQFIAVVTGLSEETASAAAVVIPSSVVVQGITYEVVAITDNAFGANDIMETLVLPNKNVQYSSVALQGCSNLGIIQYNDIIPFAESTQTVADLPVASAQSLIENSNDDETPIPEE